MINKDKSVRTEKVLYATNGVGVEIVAVICAALCKHCFISLTS